MSDHTKAAPSIPATMSAVRLLSPDGPAALEMQLIETPRPEADEVLVRVRAAAITRDELEWPVDRLPATPSYECSGEVVAVGAGVGDPAVGDTVFALTGFHSDGAAAELAVVGAALLASKPRRLGFVESAAVPLAALSAWQGLFDHGRVEAGQRVLIHGATGGVGGYAVQLARQRGAHVIGTASTQHLELARKLGADEVIDSGSRDLTNALEPVDVVFDTVGGERLQRSPEVLIPGGRLVSVAADPPSEDASGRPIEAVYFVVEPNGVQLAEIAALVDDGQLRPTIDAVFPLADARAAFERSLGAHGPGKIVLADVDDRGRAG